MTSRWSRVGRSLGAAWARTARLRAGTSAAVRAGLVTAEAARSVAATPLPPTPDTARTTTTPQVRVERLSARQVADFARRDLEARGEGVRRATTDPPRSPEASERRPAAERTERALGRGAPLDGGATGRRGPGTPGRGR